MFRNHDHTYAKIQETEFDYVSSKFEITSLCDKNGNQMSKVSTDAQQDLDSSSVKDIEFRNSSLKASHSYQSQNKDKTDITLKQKTFIITKRAAGVPIKEIQEQWKSHFERTPPECRTIIRIYQKAISENSIESKKCNSGRKRTVRTKEIIAGF